MSEDEAEEERRRREINMFSALASGDFSSGTFESSGLKGQGEEEEEESFPEGEFQELEADSMKNMFAQAASQIDNSGTFSLSTKASLDRGKASNLEAAAAALDDEGGGSNQAVATSAFAATNRVYPNNRPAMRKIPSKTRMTTQEVILPRPLLFGPDLPPRVVTEARKIVSDALEQHGYDPMSEEAPPISELPPDVRNLISAIGVYGNGISVLPGEENSRSTSYVSIFCPKWSEDAKEPDGESLFPGLADSSQGSVISTDPQSGTVSTMDAVAQEKSSAAIPNGQSATDGESVVKVDTSLSERDMFSLWARGEDENHSQDNMSASTGSSVKVNSMKHEDGNSIDSISNIDGTPVPMSDQDLFSQWARGESPANAASEGSSVGFGNAFGSAVPFNDTMRDTGKAGLFNTTGTFMNLTVGNDDSDDDSVVGSELKKKVGVNEHLNAALASLEEDFSPNSTDSDPGSAIDDAAELAQVPLTPDGGRPLTNHELMNGATPLFGHDDSPLPAEADLGIHETKDEQQRSREQRRNQAIIESCCPQNIFGPLACPNPALTPDDNHSWNSRVGNQTRSPGIPRSVGAPNAHVGVVPSPGKSAARKTAKTLLPPRPPKGSPPRPAFPFLRNKTLDSRSRYGWWNVPLGDEEPDASAVDSSIGSLNTSFDAEGERREPPLVIPPWEHSASTLLVQTQLEPSPEQLQEQNRPLSHLHPATSVAQALPFLSDRAPSYRYLQIDTQAVGFPSLGGEIEPFFCSLAIYHIERRNPSGGHPSMAPIPDLQRCSKVTETLNFDVVSDPEIESRCSASLWPGVAGTESERLQGTRCGVFPLPSNLNIHNLYAVLIVKKVISEGSDFEVYLRPKKTSSGDQEKQENVDIDLLRARAEKAADRQGQFIMPFAFGVAPLQQVFGADVPVVPNSRAVQIPLFRFSSGQGERQIIDHIMVMLFPRADHRASGIGGPAPVTNGGTAMLVMRNFGYLGLNSVVNSKSSLARDRLVDFTGDLQIRQDDGSENLSTFANKNVEDNASIVHRVPEWSQQFFAEPTQNGGRNASDAESTKDSDRNSHLYAQELAPLPLHASPSARLAMASGHRGRGSSSADDIEPYYHAKFCNELVCQPRILRNCPKGNIVVKVEMREMEWIPKYSAYFAHLPPSGPAIHNPRRGPFLVQGAFTSCSARCPDPHFLDEFKLKLPLLIKAHDEETQEKATCLFFTVYRLSFSSRKKWGKRFRGSRRTGRKVDEIAGDLVGESIDEMHSSNSCHLIQLGCGYLPLLSNQALLSSGNHDIKLTYTARKPQKDFSQTGGISPSSIIVSESPDLGRRLLGTSNESKGDADEIYTEDSESVGSSIPITDTASATSATDSQAKSETTEDRRTRHLRQKSGMEAISLQIRVFAQSSLYVQNSTLGDFLCQEPAIPRPFKDVTMKMLPPPDSDANDIYQFLCEQKASVGMQYETDKLLLSIVDISKASMCSISDVSNNLLRVISQLWKVLLAGTAEPSVEWANPAAIIPLRVQSFATLLQVLGSSAVSFRKRGVTQLDGQGKWNLILMSRVVSLLFDEGTLFGDKAEESIPVDLFVQTRARSTNQSTKNSKKGKRRRHVRSSFEFLNNGTSIDGLPDVQDNSLGDILDGVNSDSDSSDSNPSRSLLGTTASIITTSSDTISSYYSNSTQAEVAVSVEHPLEISAASTSVKLDSVTDFKSALKAGQEDPIYQDADSKGAQAAFAMIKAFSGSTAGAKRFWTAPAPGLATIREDADGDDPQLNSSNTPARIAGGTVGPLDSLDTELFVRPRRSSVKQFRVPNLKTPARSAETLLYDKSSEDVCRLLSVDTDKTAAGSFEDDVAKGLSIIPFDSDGPGLKNKKDSTSKHRKSPSQTLPTSDAEIESAGTSFLDAIEKSLGLSAKNAGTTTGEEKRVGHAHHKKTRSRSSIDWTIPNDDLATLVSDSSSEELRDETGEAKNKFDSSMSSLTKEKMSCVRLPSYVDRLASLSESEAKSGRWFPFAYETIIMQWAAVLLEHRSDKNSDRNASSATDSEASLVDATSRTSGVAIACAPVLFEIIKQSLGWRVANLFRRVQNKDFLEGCPPLVTLDDAILSRLKEVIVSITDVCLDNRNFDSWDTRQTCIDVNDSIVHFLRDLFAFLDPSSVFELITAYLSVLLSRDGGRSQDRDSHIGLRCSWEITKLQMNAVSAFVRFPDFVKVNSPQMNNWGDWWVTAPATSTVTFFDDIHDQFQKLGKCSTLMREDGVGIHSSSDMMRPHWLAEIVVDILILGTEHAEQNIQRRAGSMLLEMFWEQSQQSMREGNSTIVASMYITFLEKVLCRTSYLSSCFSPKSQVRQDILRCITFVIQSAPAGLLRALWRKLCARATGKNKSISERYGGIGYAVFAESLEDTLYQDGQRRLQKSSAENKQEPDIFDMFSLLNLSLATFEYEGSDELADVDVAVENEGPQSMWRKEFILSREQETSNATRRRRLLSTYGNSPDNEDIQKNATEYTTSSSRKWHSHDGSISLIRAAEQIVRELRFVLEPSEEAQSFFNPARRKARANRKGRNLSNIPSLGSRDSHTSDTGLGFSYIDTVVFVRAATSVYLHSLILRQSDIAHVKALNASVDVIKIFGIKIFNEAVGETLQHWMRVVSFHCGSRRAEVRVPASDFLELILRSTWDSFGSFFRIRLPLLAVQTEVMERIVATAAARHYRDQRRMGSAIDLFSNGSAEASLAPLWRTLDRLHHQSASQNVAFRSALIRLAEKLKKLFRAYIAAHALSFLNRSKAPGLRSEEIAGDREAPRNLEAETLIRASRISVNRVINASAGYSKQFLGFYSTSNEHSAVAHHEAVEDAFLDAADVFSPTELPDHRVAWLRKLAEFHASRYRFAEEATCHYHIHVTLKQASRLHGALWSSTPFLPWTDNMSDGIHLDGEGPAGDPDDCDSDFGGEVPEIDYGRQIDKNNSFRRIFYRNENSIRINGGELEAGTSRYAFCGITLPSEFHTVSPWISLREMEANMLEEAEIAGDLYLKSGIVASSRYAWSLATRYYAEKFSYGKLAHVYDRLARTVVSQVPPIDSSMQEVCVTVPLGRFYRVWFHGGAPDELIGAEFVYRTASNIKLEKFGKELRDVIRCIIPDKTPIHLVLDGRPEEQGPSNYAGFSRMGAPLDPVRVKVTPLRPIMGKSSRIRGLPEWFHSLLGTTVIAQPTRSTSMSGHSLHRSNSMKSNGVPKVGATRHRDHSRSFSASVLSSSGASSVTSRHPSRAIDNGHFHFDAAYEGELVGADKFSFTQPINKDRSRGTRDWLRGSSGDFAEKTLRLTQLQVGQAFPACVSRQAVVHRVVFTQSPLEAAVDSVCQWCSILFRTAIATNGMVVLGINYDPGIGIEAAKVVSDCIHSSRVKEIGVYLLKKNTNVEEEEDADVLHSYDRLGEDEVTKLQLKLSRSLIIFMELLHLLIARNRDLLLNVIQERKKGDSHHSHTRTLSRGDFSFAAGQTDARTNRSFPRSMGGQESFSSKDSRAEQEIPPRSHHKSRSSSSHHGGGSDENLTGTFTGNSAISDRARTDSAIGIQSELQRAFVSLAKDLHPMIKGIMSSETPGWLKQCCQDNYFSAYTYRQTKIPMAEELTFEDVSIPAVASERVASVDPSISARSQASVDAGMIPNTTRSSSTRTPNSPGGSLGSSSAVSRGSEAAKSYKSLRSQQDRLASC